MKLPWSVPKSSSQTSQQSDSDTKTNARETAAPDQQTEPEANSSEDVASIVPRVLHLRHFTKALKEISPSSSESLGTLTALRKWNEEFGEGHSKKKKIMWGKGLFGFAEKGADVHVAPDGKVSAAP